MSHHRGLGPSSSVGMAGVADTQAMRIKVECLREGQALSKLLEAGPHQPGL